MSTPEQDTSHHKFSKTRRLPPPPPAIYRKTRSHSLSADGEQSHESSNDEIIPSEQLDFSEIRKKFENPTTPEISQPHTYKKRPSVPIAAITQRNISPPLSPSSISSNTIITTHFKQSNEITTAQITSVRQTISSKTKSSTPTPLTDGSNSTIIKKILRSSLNSFVKNGLHSPIEEQDNPLSNDPKSPESSLQSDNENNEQAKSVRKIRDFFDGYKNPHVYQVIRTNLASPSTRQSDPSNLTSNSRQLPPRPPPRPENYLKSQISDWNSIPSLDIIDNITGDSSLSSNLNLSQCNSSDVSFTDEEEDYEAERQSKLRRCLEEVHTTEKTYVNILYVLSVKLSAEIKNTCDKDDNLILIFNNTYKPLLGTIQQIYQLHYTMILPEIEEYIIGQRTGNMWSIFEKNFKVIEVLYKNYYVTYYDTQGKLDDLCKNYPLINDAMLKCQALLGNLYPITQLNCPNQRLLRYILCMKTYMKHLDQNSTEYKYIRSIHDEFDRIAGRCEEELVISAAQLNELKERLDNKFECIKEHRKLLWHGPIKKVSPRRHNDIAQRYMILFSDCLLVCNEDSGRKLDIKRELSMRGITIDIIPNVRTTIVSNNDQQNISIIYYPFRVNAVEKSYEFLVDKESDRELWVKKIRQASEDYNRRNSMIEMRQSINQSDEQQLGTRAPAWINDLDVTRCQNCNNRFRTTIILSRRHHCRCCGRCVCGSCSTKKLVLEYCKHEGEVRVCDTCYTHFTGTELSKNTSIWPKTTRDIDRTILFGDFRTVNSGTNIWIALQEDYHLHIYGAKLDQAEEYSINLCDLIELQLESDTRTFTLRETTKTHIFAIDLNHQIRYEKNNLIDEKLKNFDNKLTFYTNLWLEAMQLARSTTLPEWYIRKRDSADSGVSIVG
ncbi:unnamed protein product [Rotaria sordida]|uniref:Uncharacterized protein n=1 Tax=Rotaria sordida TaxID=392033 RepID=A0A814VXU5_9BILA|nr:unnamed protein product [Rotaria sordida]